VIQWSDAPYLHGVETSFCEPAVYAEMRAAWPDSRMFQMMGAGYRKLACSSRYAPVLFTKIVERVPIWGLLYREVKSPGFSQHWLNAARKAGAPMPDGPVSARFEFSALPADGGFLAPHRDTPGKLLTLVVPIVDPSDGWEPAWGGGTALLRPKETEQPLRDYCAGWGAFDVVTEVPYAPNQALVFIRSDVSWHGVMPLTGPAGKERRSLTINIEAVK
jgi:hypothetical protein